MYTLEKMKGKQGRKEKRGCMLDGMAGRQVKSKKLKNK